MIYNRQFAAIPVRFDLRGASAGQYRGGASPCIRFNSAIAARHWVQFCERTIPHEVSHYIVDQLYRPRRVKPHGKEWKSLMIEFGADPSRCHSYDITGFNLRRQTRHAYYCDCREHQLSATRHKRILQRKMSYHCSRCGSPLRRGKTQS